MLDIPYDVEQRQELFQRISPRLRFELKLQDVVTRCCIAVAQNSLRKMSAEQERSLDTLLNIFQAQINSVSLDCASGRRSVFCSHNDQADVPQISINCMCKLPQ
jgi:hypothetical protein